jgi:hypothetical protein
MTTAKTTKTATKAENAEKAPTMTIPTEPLKKDPNRVPQHNEDVVGFKPPKPEGKPEEEATKDTIYPVAGRARWGNNDQAEMLADSRKVDQLVAESEK